MGQGPAILAHADAAVSLPSPHGAIQARLMPERALCLAGTLLVSDLHLGKADALHADTGLVPQPVLERLIADDLARLSRAAARAQVHHIVIAGDLLHATRGLSAKLIDLVAADRSRNPIPWIIVPGNHDKGLSRLADPWRLEIAPAELCLAPGLIVTHAPRSHPDAHVIAGHEHPALTLRRGTDAIKLPAFVLTPAFTILPAFTRFAAGGGGPWPDSARLFACGPDAVFEVPAAHAR